MKNNSLIKSGPTMNIEQIKKIHLFLTKYFETSEDPISPPGVKDIQLLESSVSRPFMSVGGQDAYKGVFDKAAALFHSIINNHCFYNGNKRTALLTTMVFLGENHYWLNQPADEDLFEFTRKAAAHELAESRNDELKHIALWFQDNSRRRVAGEQPLKYHELKEILSGFGYEINDVVGTTCDIYKEGKFITTIRNKGRKGLEDYDKQYIKTLRRKLKLTPEFGVDSYSFYGDKGLDKSLHSYVKMRESVMRWLAKI